MLRKKARKLKFNIFFKGKGNGIYVSISKYGSDTPVTRPESYIKFIG